MTPNPSRQLYALPFATVSIVAFVLASRSDGGPQSLSFSDQTAAAGVQMNHATAGFPLLQYAGGACIGDFNRDGWMDLFVLSGGLGSVPDRLFINDGDGTFTDRAAEWGITAPHKGKAACAGDFDGDGWLDIYVCSAGPWGSPAAPGHNKLYRNNAGGGFTDVAPNAGVATVNPISQDSWAAAFGDYDLDGDLDLFVGGFLTASPSNVGNRLFRNDGDGTFTDVTAAIGLLDGLGPMATFGVAFVDTNGDRWPELLLSADFKGANFIGSRYFANDGDGTFTDLTDASSTGEEENGMGQARGDFNNDGMLDWYVTSTYFPDANWTGNKLYTATGAHSFVENGEEAGCVDGGYGWGTVAIDFDHDGWQDIAETNGDGASIGPFANEQAYLWINDGDGTFTERALDVGFEHFGSGKALLSFDYDNDGDQDVVIVTNSGPLLLLRNDLSGPGTGWLRVFLDTSGDPALAPDGFGSKVEITAGGVTQTRWIDGGSSAFGTSELSAHFGLSGSTLLDAVTVHWNDGRITTLEDVAVNQTLVVSPGGSAPCTGDLDGSGAVDGADLGLMLGQWGGAGDADLDGNGSVDGADLGLLLGAWGAC